MKIKLNQLLLAAIFLGCWSGGQETKIVDAKNEFFYVGTYTSGTSEGIYKCMLDEHGDMEIVGLAVKADNPSFLAKSHDDQYLLAVNESEKGTIASYEIAGDSLNHLSTRSSGGAHPCFITMNENSQVLTANYTGGNIGFHRLDEKGGLSEILDLQQHGNFQTDEEANTPHAHSVWFNEKGNNIIAVDLGTNELLFSSIDSKNEKFVPAEQRSLSLPDGAGPRHLAIHPKHGMDLCD